MEWTAGRYWRYSKLTQAARREDTHTHRQRKRESECATVDDWEILETNTGKARERWSGRLGDTGDKHRCEREGERERRGVL